MDSDVTTLEPDELRAAHTLFAAAIHRGPLGDDEWALAQCSYVPGRTIGVRENGTPIATATAFAGRTAVPGGAVLPMAGVTRVGVRADRTRRGLLSAMMRAQLADVAARGEVLASLRASEARIYGRFGYGVASRARNITVTLGRTGWRDCAPSGGDVRLLARDEITTVLPAVHDRIALRRTGGITRTPGWWGAVGRRVANREHVVAAVHTGPDGDDGFALAVPGDDMPGFGAALRVEDLQAADTAATAGLWRFLLGVDLVRQVDGSLRPLDEPLELLLADPRDCTTTGTVDETWLRLVDVPAALAARTFGAADPVVLAVHDTGLPANAGVYRIGAAGAERVGPLGSGPAPDLECGVAALAMPYHGDRAPSELAATGWWRVHDPAAPARADVLFGTAEVPWCGTYF